MQIGAGLIARLRLANKAVGGVLAGLDDAAAYRDRHGRGEGCGGRGSDGIAGSRF
jgi:hypothetical protein